MADWNLAESFVKRSFNPVVDVDTLGLRFNVLCGSDDLQESLKLLTGLTHPHDRELAVILGLGLGHDGLSPVEQLTKLRDESTRPVPGFVQVLGVNSDVSVVEMTIECLPGNPESLSELRMRCATQEFEVDFIDFVMGAHLAAVRDHLTRIPRA